ncbi:MULTISPECIES: FAD/NAD(P)-binding protein [Dyella]|uniref:Pyridine nucleotide-disulfide oxidoreductase n=2 Tax=Dyella TaxID=231454 RepID=A0A4R0YYP7_9GAMM|nr:MULTISPECIES: FAD/NAD(P)-binding protein [Dyella]TBR40503.1 pyridine nucleotide-disulfide oxidoreductase [Dyella terrae]TCI11916.1 pyridine nucleotide-disulfide oxidoreductase [Dyella soli]
MYRRVAIIGGGAASAALLSEILERQHASPVHLDWYTGGGSLGRGIAYGTRSDRHLLNVRAASMSMFVARPRGFLDYAQRGDHSIAGTDFLPRRMYGDYLEAEVRRSLDRAAELGHDVRVIPFAVDAIVPENDGVTVIQGEESTRVDAAVLALGALPPQPLGGVTEAALTSGRYIVDPWRFLASAQPSAEPFDVVLVGMGLTSVDVVLELAELWPKARFTALSRHGLLPEPHLAVSSAPTDDGSDLIESMLAAPDIRTWMRLLREAIRQTPDWRVVIDSLRPHTPSLWRALPREERARFLRHARWAWERARHRMAPQVAEALARLEREGRLVRRRGRMQAVDVKGDALQLELRPKGSAFNEQVTADYVIQTIGLNTDVRRAGHPLVNQLFTNGHITPDALGLGAEGTLEGRLRHGGATWPHFYAIGSMLRGTHWESTAMPEIRQQARNLADQLFGS